MVVSIPKELAREFRQLGTGENAQPVAVFSAKAIEAYTLVAALQTLSRHPHLSETQLEIVLGFAHQIGDQLVAMARSIVGPESAVERTLLMGFDPQYDFQVEPSKRDDEHQVEEIGASVSDLSLPGENGDRCRYVKPQWIRLGDDEGELHKCAGCNRFFVQGMPIVAFLGEGDDTLNVELCDNCAPKLVGRRGSPPGA